MGMKEITREMKLVSPQLAGAKEEQRNKALLLAAQNLNENKEEIFAANREDVERAQDSGVSQQVIRRLKFDEHKLADVTAGMHSLVSLPDPVGKVTLKRELDENLILTRISCPIGVIGVIFEARPDALVQISSLCLKSGNCAILKGGRETQRTNAVLFKLLHDSFTQAGIPESAFHLAVTHTEIDELLACNESVDLLIPRGSNKFVQYIMENTKIPVMGHADGVCHVYVDEGADQEMALKILVDAKTQYPVACNAAETLLVYEDIAEEFLAKVAGTFAKAGIQVRGYGRAAELLSCESISEDQFHHEYGDLEMTVKTVKDVAEAVDHINRYGSHHTDCIVTANDVAADYFMKMVDSAGVYRNVSTRFADGFRYGFGAEVGISTGKLHARGPVGLDGLVTYKYELTGNGQIVGDYASGKSEFHFRDI